MVVALNQDMMQEVVRCVAVMVKLDQVRVFLQCNKHALNVQDRAKKLQIHVTLVMVRGKNKSKRDCQ